MATVKRPVPWAAGIALCLCLLVAACEFPGFVLGDPTLVPTPTPSPASIPGAPRPMGARR